jgi:hypothetical protein
MKAPHLLFLALLAGPLAATAHTYLQIICEPGVQIALNDTLKGTSNWKDGGLHLKISPGEYQVTARKQGYAPQTRKISLNKSDVKIWELAPFTPLKGIDSPDEAIRAPYGTLTVYSRPRQCEITLVRSLQSKASWKKSQNRWTAQKIPAGKYTVKATAGNQILSYDIEIPPSGGVVLYFDFRAGAASLRDVFYGTADG